MTSTPPRRAALHGTLRVPGTHGPLVVPGVADGPCHTLSYTVAAGIFLFLSSLKRPFVVFPQAVAFCLRDTSPALLPIRMHSTPPPFPAPWAGGTNKTAALLGDGWCP